VWLFFLLPLVLLLICVDGLLHPLLPVDLRAVVLPIARLPTRCAAAAAPAPAAAAAASSSTASAGVSLAALPASLPECVLSDGSIWSRGAW